MRKTYICIDYLEHKYFLTPTDEFKNNLKNYFKGNLKIARLKEFLDSKVSMDEVDFFKKVHTGFQFIDCIILASENTFKNSKDIDFIINQNEVLLVFSKHEIDDRKIPCPVCASLNISGNSYPAVGIKSWECKNDLCAERSKTNRGKRYSSRSNDMQTGVYIEHEANIINKDLIAMWRKDIVLKTAQKTLFEMIVKYFSYHGAKVLFLNFNPESYYVNKDVSISRKISFKKIELILPFNNFDKKAFSSFVNGELMSKFIYNNNSIENSHKIDLLKINKYEIVNTDCFSFLKNIPNNSIHHMVTSPPYYNAREYSHWKNLYNYLNDMYKICVECYNAIVPGGVFFYNIGDIFDNPNTVVKSKMGEKRVALGAYLILIFKYAGFELLDNIIWNKGETQSNRHKNDGNFTPYYQRPTNCYEHMFIFKKPGKLILNDRPILKNNIQKFSPVIKINNKGENLFGHTAPYPPELPALSINSFTNEGDIVYDPFLGSGTTVYTAVNNNRIGIGTELDTTYFILAKSNIEKKINVNLRLKLV